MFVFNCIFSDTSYISGLGGRYYFQIHYVSPVDVFCTSRISVLLGSLKNHRLAWAGRDLKDHLIQPPAIGSFFFLRKKMFVCFFERNIPHAQ